MRRFALWFLPLVPWLLGMPMMASEQPAPTSIRLVTESSEPFEVRLVFEPASGQDDSDGIFELGGQVPGTLHVDLSAAALWTLRAESETHWTPPRVVASRTADPQVAGIDLHFVPTFELRGRVVVAEGSAPTDPVPTDMDLRFEPVDPAPAEGIGDTLPCQLALNEGEERADVHCRVPEGRWDLRLKSPGFAALYRWSVDIRAPIDPEGDPYAVAKPIDLGLLQLHPGATLVGRVALASGEPLPEGVQLRLAPASTLSGRTRTTERAALRILEAEPDERGRFVFVDAEAGIYTLEAAKKGFAPAELGPLHLRRGEAMELDEPLLLHPPLRLEVVVTPPVDAFGEPWRVSYLSTDDPGIHGAGPVDGEGRWRGPELDPGRYLVAVRDGEGSFGRQEIHELFHGSDPLGLEMETVPIEGVVTLGDEPVSATLWFGGRNGLTSIEVETDDEGLFFGVLPREGTWELDIRAPELDIHRRLRRLEVETGPDGVAELEIRLPDTRIEGRVVDGEGNAVPDARVLASGFGSRERPSQVRADEDGHFAYRGFEPGTYYLQALGTGGRQSDPREGQVDEDRPWTGARLVVEDGRILGGRVFDAETGLPVVGAQVSPRIRNARVGVISTPDTTDPEGRFEIRLPSAITEADLAILARGYDLALASPQSGAGNETPIGLRPESGTVLVIPAVRSLSVDDMAESGLGYAFLQDSSGRTLDLQLLRQWSHLQGERGGEALRVPNLPPDVYTLCWRDASPPPTGSTSSTAVRPSARDCETRALGPFSEAVFDLPDNPDPREASEEEAEARDPLRGDS